jgi:hypothetical protein
METYQRETHQSEFEVRLPIGYRDPGGNLHRRAVLRKMRGHEEAVLYDPTLSGGALVTELLAGCLVRLGSLPAVDRETVSGLYSADRNYLLLELRRITLGDRMPAVYPCPGCGARVAVTEDLGQLPVRRLADGETLPEIRLTLEDGYTDRRGVRHTELTLTLPRGSDEEFVAPMVAKDPLKAQDALMLRCIRRFGDLPRATLEAYGVKILRDLTLGDRRLLQACFNDRTPGVDFMRPVSCTACGTAFSGVLDVSHFFVAG